MYGVFLVESKIFPISFLIFDLITTKNWSLNVITTTEIKDQSRKENRIRK